ncbi:enoyl-CoA hydratase/isomerase-like protein [Alcanivorax sp. S71-1-4]|jgi:2-(1,2-epoxy-1,2-dihydrophenyl)acetyl-CoA isomerase|uniref:enoyl-CoA hydratase/isomerase family protein n=1 Tax=Alcanivorax sp. S71-1-4 TaxID=1177159 RepID=UPI001359DD58|nr:enoyl-CoA hydratase-related protein [Alcanivorax sp. S71-1-4]KAF0809974.1 enoyl-CoA hydratase/isomerase-like protein [Alcanivorax sp. S71-1-4]
MAVQAEHPIEQRVSEGPVLLDIHDQCIAHIRLNRPEAANGLSVELLKALYDVIMTCHGDPRLRAVVLTGEGKHFCAGGDVRDFASKGEQLPDYLRQATSYLQIVAGALIRLGPPVMVSVQGFAAGGGGLGLVCAADLVIAGDDASFMAGGTRVGMAPDAGATVTLSRIVGLRRAMDILLNNPVIDAASALEMGLINRVVPAAEREARTWAWARELAAGAPLALAATKRMVWNGVGLGVEACLPEESRTVSALSGTADSREGLAAVIEKRKPVFTGR